MKLWTSKKLSKWARWSRGQKCVGALKVQKAIKSKPLGILVLESHRSVKGDFWCEDVFLKMQSTVLSKLKRINCFCFYTFPVTLHNHFCQHNPSVLIILIKYSNTPSVDRGNLFLLLYVVFFNMPPADFKLCFVILSPDILILQNSAAFFTLYNLGFIVSTCYISWNDFADSNFSLNSSIDIEQITWILFQCIQLKMCNTILHKMEVLKYPPLFEPLSVSFALHELSSASLI